jgi:hypothetical protein
MLWGINEISLSNPPRIKVQRDMKRKEKQENLDFAHPVGKSSILRIDWKSFKKEMPKSGQDIWVVLKARNGYHVVTGTYFNEVIPASKDGNFPETTWKIIKFHDFGCPDILVGKQYANKNQKRLMAWGVNRGIIRLAKFPKDWTINAPSKG